MQTWGPWLLALRVQQPKYFIESSALIASEDILQGGPHEGLTYVYLVSVPKITGTGAPQNPPEIRAPATGNLTSGGTWAQRGQARSFILCTLATTLSLCN